MPRLPALSRETVIWTRSSRRAADAPSCSSVVGGKPCAESITGLEDGKTWGICIKARVSELSLLYEPTDSHDEATAPYSPSSKERTLAPCEDSVGEIHRPSASPRR